MLKKMLKNPVGIAGILVLAFGILAGTSYDGTVFEEQEARYAQNTAEAVAIMRLNMEKRQEKDKALIMIWGSIGFGLLMLGSAAWNAFRGEEETDENHSDPNAPIVPE